MATYPRRRAGLVDRIIDGERVLLDSERGLVHKLNSTASQIWDRCDGVTPLEAICGQLADEFDRASDEIEPDVRTLVERLHEVGVLDTDLSKS